MVKSVARVWQRVPKSRSAVRFDNTHLIALTFTHVKIETFPALIFKNKLSFFHTIMCNISVNKFYSNLKIDVEIADRNLSTSVLQAFLRHS
jgi:hypothetical protein